MSATDSNGYPDYRPPKAANIDTAKMSPTQYIEFLVCREVHDEYNRRRWSKKHGRPDLPEYDYHKDIHWINAGEGEAAWLSSYRCIEYREAARAHIVAHEKWAASQPEPEQPFKVSIW